MKVLLIKNGRIYHYNLPKEVKENFWITDIDSYDNLRNLINVEASDGRWILTSNYETHIVDTQNMHDRVYLSEYQFYTIKNDSEKNYYYLYAIPDIESSYVAYNIVSNGGLIIGQNDTCDIIYHHVLISDMHAKLDYNNGLWQITDNNTPTGVYVNDCRIPGTKVLKYGDIIFIAGLKIIVMNNFLLINAVKNAVRVSSSILRIKPKEVYQISNVVLKDEELNRSLYAKEEYFYRSPRFIEDIYKEEVVIDNPPAKINQQEQSFILTYGPMFTMALTSFTTAFTTINNVQSGTTTWKQSIPSLVTAGSMFLSMLIWPIIARIVEKRRRKKLEKQRVEKYTEYLDSKAKEIDGIIAKQSQTLKDKYIPLSECANIIMRKKSNLWERNINQEDFLALRLGLGNTPIFADIKYSKESFSMEEDELKSKISEIADERKLLKNVPITVSLTQKNITSIVGNNALLHDFFKGILLQLMTYHSYEFLKIVVLTNNETAGNFEYMRNLPYLFDNTKQMRFFADNLDETKEISLYLERIFQDRKANGKKFGDTPPYYLIITDNYHMYREVEIIRDILDSEVNMGFGLIIFSEKIQNLPSECKNFINVNRERSGIFESEISMGNQKEFQTEFCDGIDFDECIRKICNIPIEFNDDDKALPNSISFLGMYNVGKVEQLNVLQRYQSNNSQKSLSVPIGIEKSGTVLKLDLHEKYHGPHGLIAGMTGSGKSEFIITYVLSMATNFSPNDVAFILIDYKGGGLAGAFENRETGVSLPHLAGTITNLDVSEMNRSLSSIQSELRRRQQLFNEARDKLGESTVDIYKYQKFFKDGKVTEPVPHLFIISDEFAELKSQQPEFMDQLISTARIGRSLGVHLILATQKPSGVVNDQIWSNSRFRVCLKVQEKGDSNEMIKTPDAAFLKQAGRFYLQVGYNELFALGQSAWCGAQYYPTEKIKKKIDQSVVVIDDIGNVISQNDDMKETNVKSSGEELSNILSHIIKVCDEKKLKAQKLWLEKIAANIYVDNLIKKYKYTPEPFILKPIVGEYDDPNNQRQDLLTINLTDDGNTTIYGSSGSGKELLLSSLIYSLIICHTPDEVNIYIMDFGSGTLGSFRGIPHVGDIILANEEEKVKNTFKMIENELENRKKLFLNYNGDFQNYIKRSGNTVPYIILFINYYDVFQETYDYDDIINRISRECSKYGIIMIPTINSTGGMRYKLRQNFHSDITLQFNDQDDYSVIIGNTRKLYPTNIFGRGLVKLDNIYEFQTARIDTDEKVQDKIDFIIKEMKNKYPVSAKKIPVVPEHVYVSDLVGEIHGTRGVPVGINKDTIATELFNFKDNFATLLSANDIELVPSFVKPLISMFTHIDNQNIIVIDPDESLKDTYSDKVEYVNSDVSGVIKNLIADVNSKNEIYEKDGYSDKNIKNMDETSVVLYNFNKILLKISPDDKKEFLSALEKCKNLGIFNFIIIDTVDNLKKMEYDSWYKSIVQSNYGIWIGNGVADQNLIKTNIGFKKTNNEIPVGYGIIVKNSKTSLVNLIEKDINTNALNQNEEAL